MPQTAHRPTEESIPEERIVLTFNPCHSCSNPLPHGYFEFELDGRTGGVPVPIPSLVAGRRVLQKLRQVDDITEEDQRRLEGELANAGLPEVVESVEVDTRYADSEMENVSRPQPSLEELLGKILGVTVIGPDLGLSDDVFGPDGFPLDDEM